MRNRLRVTGTWLNDVTIYPSNLTHWGRVTHICVGNLTTIGSDNGFSPGRPQAIIWINAGILLIGPLWTNISEILTKYSIFLFKKMRLKVSSAKWRPFCLGLNVLSAIINARKDACDIVAPMGIVKCTDICKWTEHALYIATCRGKWKANSKKYWVFMMPLQYGNAICIIGP